MHVRITATILLISFALLQHTHAETLEDAENKLNELRKQSADGLAHAFQSHISMSDKIDSAALATKTTVLRQLEENLAKSTLQMEATEARARFFGSYADLCFRVAGEKLNEVERVAANAVSKCVDSAAADAITFIYKQSTVLVDYVLTANYDEEKNIIKCAAADSKCYSDAIKSIDDHIATVLSGITFSIQKDADNLSDYLKKIEACGAVVGLGNETIDKSILDNVRHCISTIKV